MITNALMNNSEFPLYQQKSNLELSAAECVFLEIKKSTGYPSCPLCSLPLPPCLSAQTQFWDLARDRFFASECLHLRFKQVLCNSVCSHPVVSMQGYSETATEALLQSRISHLLSMCVYSYISMPLYKHTCKLHTHNQCVLFSNGVYSPFAALLVSLQHSQSKTRRLTVTSNFIQQFSPFLKFCACRQPCPEVSGALL